MLFEYTTCTGATEESMHCNTDFDMTHIFLVVFVLNRNGIERLQLSTLMGRIGWRGRDEGKENKGGRE